MRPLFAIAGLAFAAAAAAVALSLLDGCGGDAWTPADTTAHQKAVTAGKTLVSTCRSDAGCSPGTCAIYVEAIDCQIGSSLYHHGGGDLLGPEAGCANRGTP